MVDGGRGAKAQTIPLPDGQWQTVKILAAVRGTTIRQLVGDVLRREIAAATRHGELPAPPPRPAAPAQGETKADARR